MPGIVLDALQKLRVATVGRMELDGRVDVHSFTFQFVELNSYFPIYYLVCATAGSGP